jgi:hypothetical protein
VDELGAPFRALFAMPIFRRPKPGMIVSSVVPG